MLKMLAIALLGTITAAALPYEVTELRNKRDAKVAEIDRVYLDELEKLKTNYVKAGNLEVANAIRDIIDGMRAPVIVGGDDALRKSMNGTSWKREGSDKVLTFRPDGKVSKSWGQLTPGWEVRNGRIHAEGTEFAMSKDNKSLKARGGKKDGQWTRVE